MAGRREGQGVQKLLDRVEEARTAVADLALE